jgi:hypothetical protein
MDTKLASLFGNGFLSSTSDCYICQNENLEDKPLVTKLMDPMGNPRTDTVGREIGTIRIEQEVNALNSGYWNDRRRVAFVTGSYDQLVARLEQFNIKHKSLVPGRIRVIESPDPLYKNHTPKINPSTQEVICVNVGALKFPIYLRMEYDETGKSTDRYIRTADDLKAYYENIGKNWIEYLAELNEGAKADGKPVIEMDPNKTMKVPE